VTSAETSGSRVCLFGGTFDPVHNAHLAIAREAARQLNLSSIVFLPAGHPPHKQLSQVTPYKHRLRMVELACASEPRFQVSMLEQGDQFSYSIDTVEALRKKLPRDVQLSFLIGSDAFDEIETWHRWRDLVEALEFVVVSRPGHDFRVAPGAKVHRLDGLALPISSTDIRARLAKHEPTPELPPAVRQYIDENHLYGS
jgi:nicotinate-nucleotide adenylyltransferase